MAGIGAAEPSVCMSDPGLEVNLFVTADTIAIHKVWMGMASLADCTNDCLIEFHGLADHVKAFPGWFKISLFPDVKPVVKTG